MTLDVGKAWVVKQGDAAWPRALDDLGADAPNELYVLGDIKAACGGLAVVGGRRATMRGLDIARDAGRTAAGRGATVVSGGALGIDAAALEGALDAGGRAVAVLAGGFEHLYPAANAALFERIVSSGGALLCENPPGFPIARSAFLRRNRIVAALASTLLAVEGRVPSGTLSTAQRALALGRAVAVPRAALEGEGMLGELPARLAESGALAVDRRELACML